MASSLDYRDLLQRSGFAWQTVEDLFAAVPSVASPLSICDSLGSLSRLATTVNTPKARSEWMIAPLLGHFWSHYRGQISLFSGVTFDPDPAKSLAISCDFLLACAPQQPQVVAPVVMTIVEKGTKSLDDGLWYCIDAMIGAQRFNLRNQRPLPAVYGCLTSGSIWRFLCLRETSFAFDLMEYDIHQLDKLFGILTHIVGPPPAQPAAA